MLDSDTLHTRYHLTMRGLCRLGRGLGVQIYRCWRRGFGVAPHFALSAALRGKTAPTELERGVR